MNTKTITKNLTTLLFFFVSITVFGQRTQTHTVNFSNIDGFSGYVKFTTKYVGFATQLSADNSTLVLKKYDTDGESLAALKKAGYDLYGYPESGVTPNENYGYEVTGNAYLSTHAALREAPVSKLHINRNLGEKMVTPDFPKDIMSEVKEGNLWEETGGFRNEKVITLYISDLKNEIDRILYAAKKEKEKEEQAKKEAEEKDKAEKEKAEQETAEREKQEAEENETVVASGGNSKSSDGNDKEEEKADSDKQRSNSNRKSTQTVYYPKSNRQLYDELKAMTDANPGMLNDPNIRSQLRGYKAFADRDDRNMTNYKIASGGGYNPATYKAYANAVTTNAKIANAEIGVGVVVDEAMGLVNSIVEANNRKEQERVAEIKRFNQNFEAKLNALKEYKLQLAKNRQDFENKIKEYLIENYDSEYYPSIGKSLAKGFSVINGTIRYETEKPVYPHMSQRYFEKTIENVGYYSDDSVDDRYFYRLYVVKKDGKYGILDDFGEPIFLPQFDEVRTLSLNKVDYHYSEDKDFSPRFLVKINDKWGEILADGSVAEEIKYDGIWYMPDYRKIMKLGDTWTLKSLNNNSSEVYSTSKEIKEKLGSEVLPIYMGYRGNSEGSFNSSPIQLSKHILTFSGEVKNIELYTSTKEVFPTENKEGIIYARQNINEDKKNGWIFPFNDGWYQITFEENRFNSIYLGYTIKKMPDEFLVPVGSGSLYLQDHYNIRWGAINQNGELVLPFESLQMVTYQNQLGSAVKTEKGYYDIKGNFFDTEEMILESMLKKENVQLSTAVSETTNDGMSLIIVNGKKGIVDANNNFIVPLRYDELGSEFNEENMTWFQDGNYYGWVKSDGEEVFRIELPSEKKPENIDDFYILGGFYFSGNDSKNFIELKGNAVAIHNFAILGLRPADFNEVNVDVEGAKYFYSKIPTKSIWYDYAQMRLKNLK